eukprot:TRINITY_DN2301_c0_g1_i1.p1 TRINITY_DN2301_c0_g1~~TRINITY_DN2301_c0_g1_i1.p1  ORF type:complete len:415 (-),score=96.56 TRINITY_DN2301_c0_g1_i1:112-1356(-)
MGGKGSKVPPKEGKGKKKDTKDKETATTNTTTAAVTTTNANTSSQSIQTNPTKKDKLDSSANGSSTEEDDKDDNGWDDPVLYSPTKEKITKDDFELLTVIGKGSFGKVLQVRKKDTGKIYAMKVLRKEAIVQRKQVAHTKAEKSILAKIQHPFIVGLHYAFQTEEKLYMVLDFVNGGELFFHLKREGKFSEQRVRIYAAEIACALSHLHSFGIVYRDLKPENILLDSEGHICITDFGLSKEIQSEDTHTFCGTPEYLAPEILKGQGHGTPVDWWSLGTLIYEMLTGLPPFYSQNVNLMYQRILSGDLRFPSFITPEAQSLLEGLLCREVSKRIGDDTIKQHAFFKSIDWKKLEAKEIEAPFKPKVKNQTDVGMIDPMFTQETAVDSVVEKSVMEVAPDVQFDNFTYVNPSAIKV